MTLGSDPAPFHMLPEGESRLGRFGAGFLIEMIVLLLLIVIPLLIPDKMNLVTKYWSMPIAAPAGHTVQAAASETGRASEGGSEGSGEGNSQARDRGAAEAAHPDAGIYVSDRQAGDREKKHREPRRPGSGQGDAADVDAWKCGHRQFRDSHFEEAA
jgi:hypothetical protein